MQLPWGSATCNADPTTGFRIAPHRTPLRQHLTFELAWRFNRGFIQPLKATTIEPPIIARGATGDLAYKKIFPALQAMCCFWSSSAVCPGSSRLRDLTVCTVGIGASVL
jgi:hypothetical protein